MKIKRRHLPEAGAFFFCGKFWEILKLSLIHIFVSESAREKLSIMAPERQAGLLADILKQLGREEYLERDFLKGVLRDISRLKTWEIPLADFMPDVMSKEIFQPLYEIYERQKERQGLMDFDDILIRCKKLLTGNPQVLFLWRNRYDYILVDEFQDASRLQYELICLLACLLYTSRCV